MCQHCRRFTKYLTIKGLHHISETRMFTKLQYFSLGGLHNISKIRRFISQKPWEVYIVSQKPGGLHNFSETRKFTLYLRNQEVSIISQKPGGLHNISETRRFTSYVRIVKDKNNGTEIIWKLVVIFQKSVIDNQ